LGGIAEQGRYRIPWTNLVVAGNTVIVGVVAEDKPAFSWELWLRKKVVARIPGA